MENKMGYVELGCQKMHLLKPALLFTTDSDYGF
jgi:hypothetical protein